jgi:hypothetical protein
VGANILKQKYCKCLWLYTGGEIIVNRQIKHQKMMKDRLKVGFTKWNIPFFRKISLMWKLAFNFEVLKH